VDAFFAKPCVIDGKSAKSIRVVHVWVTSRGVV
jgi:hypothetical protein